MSLDNSYKCINFVKTDDSPIEYAVVNTDLCKKCYKCVSRCPQNAIIMGANYFPFVIQEKCVGCKKCQVW